MDDTFLRNIGYFAVPNNQTLNPVDQSGDASGLPATSLWDESNLAAAGLGRGRENSSGAPSISLDSLAPSTGSLNPYSPMISTSSMFSQNPRSIISPRVSRTRDGHERKRSRLNTETTPFDSVDYWIQFDQEQQQQQLQKQQLQQQQQQQLFLQQHQFQLLQQQQLQQQLLQQQAQRQQQQQQQQQPKRKEKQSQETANAVDASTTASSSQVKAPTPQR
ncbi:hypothetical protein SEPCBS119000_006349 [Sporothrix epigloea]|uniref:Uncharacterized protein n=1 Tax=Sporothrix epigloea TaxID=1892477 RepID=A0ABP0E6Q4_9PEZI